MEYSEKKSINQLEASPEKIGKGIFGQSFPEITLYSCYQETLEIENINLAPVFLLDTKGIIRWKGQRYARPETQRGLFETAKTLI